MSKRSSQSSSGASAEVSALIELLHATDRRLDELLHGKIDSVIDSEGRTTLLRRAQEELSQTEAAEQAAVLNALPAHIALLDRQGVIVSTNEAWRKFADANGLSMPRHGADVNYLDVCDSACGDDSLEARQVAQGIRSVLDGQAERFEIEYPCHSPTQPRWFLLVVTSLAGTALSGAVVMHVNVTERKQATDALALLSRQTGQRERMLNSALSSITDLTCIYDRSGRILFANQPLLDAWHLTLGELAGKTLSDLDCSRGFVETTSRCIREAYETRDKVFAEISYVDAQGSTRHYENIFSPACADDGGIEFVVASARDITERKDAETALRDSEAEFRTLAEAMPQIVWVARADGSSTYFNEQWTHYTGLTREKSLEHGWKRVFHLQDHERAQHAWQQARDSVATYSVEGRLRRADGTYRWWLIRGVPVQHADGSILKWLGTCTDIHDLKMAELEILATNRELQRQQTELRTLVDLVPAMIWFKDANNNILRVNRRATEMAEQANEETEEKTSAVSYPSSASGVHAQDLDIIRSGVAKLGIVEARTNHEGGQSWIQWDKVPYRDESGRVIGIVSMAQDITERKRDQDTLRALNAELESRVLARTAELNLAREEAEQASRAKSAFLATMSHEIRTPMNGVLGMIEVLQQTSLQDHQVEMVDLIRDSAFSLLRIIEDILDFSRIEAGKLAVAAEPMRLAETIEKTCGMLDHLALKQGVRLTVFVDPALPGTVIGDENRLRQVLVNLAGNAIKFSGGRGRPGRVAVRMVPVERQAQGVTVELSVTDNGIGIDEATLARLFLPFSQADSSTTRRFGGSGLGLAISSMLVRLMGGEIAVRSVVGEGSTFAVRLHFVTSGTGGPDAATALPVQGLRCRIVGRELQLARDIGACLAHAGVRVDHAPDLEAAAAAETLPGLQVWLLLPGPPPPAPAMLREAASRRPGAETRFIVLGWGRRRRPRVEAPDLVSVDADVLVGQSLLRLLASAAGRLPQDVAAEPSPQVAARPAAPRPAPQRQERTILVAEDNETNRFVILQQLALLGFAADVALDGSEALQRWRSGDFALLLTDLHMPQMDGYALTKAIRAEEKPGCRLPIVALTANALRDEELRCRAAGMDGYLSKPVRLAQLKASIEAWLGPAAGPAPAAPAAPAASPPADLDVLKALVGDDPAVIDDVLESFRESAALSNAELSRGVSAGSQQTVVDAAHKLKSAARSIGALRLGDLCARIERAAEAGKAEGLDSLLPLFHAESDAVLRFIASRREA